MKKSTYLLWLGISLLILLPSTTGKLIINLAGGVISLILLLPILAVLGGWVGWKILQSKFITCNSCGGNYMNTIKVCPICGTQDKDIKEVGESNLSQASSATIDITAEESK